MPPFEPSHRAPIGRLGSLITRLATSEAELHAAQRLRRSAFFGGDGTVRDTDEHDERCRHLLVLDGDTVVGTYRYVTAHADDAGVFHASHAFDLSPLRTACRGRRIMELGRSCIAPSHRSRRTMELLWHGAWACALADGAEVLFGTASFPGADPSTHAAALHWLIANAAPPEAQWCEPKDAPPRLPPFEPATRRTFAALPPLLKGYLRLGARVSPWPAPDPVFDTTDVLVVLEVAAISPRYLAHYGADASRFAR